MEPRGRLIEDIERAARGPARQLAGQLYPLRLAARQRRRLLADMDIAEADALQRLELVADRGHGLEQLCRFLDRHVEHVGDRLVLELDLERLAVVALALAHVAGDVDVGQKVHLDLDHAVALAGLAAAALDVEGEAAWLVAAHLGFGELGEPFADRREGAGIGGGVGARRAADRRLVDVDDLVEMLQALDRVMLAGMLARIGELARHGAVERLDEEGRLAAAGDAGDGGEQAERNVYGDVLEVVGPRANDGEPAAAGRLAALLRHGDLLEAGEILPGEALRIGHHLLGRAFGNHLAAVDASAWSHIHHMVRGEDRLLVMLDHDDAVAEIAQAVERLEQPRIVALMQPDGGLVQHIEHAGQARADLRGESDTLALAA